LTDTTLADGTWVDVLRLANRSGRAVPIVVVSRLVDIEFYIKTLESGAADFIVPPISSCDLIHVVKAAIGRHHTSSFVKPHRAVA
jgi:FixJ family two-component response regulator